MTAAVRYLHLGVLQSRIAVNLLDSEVAPCRLTAGSACRIKPMTESEQQIPWEYQLTANLVLDGIQPIKQAYDDLALSRMKASTCLDAKQCSQFVHQKLDQLAEWVKYTKQIFDKDINESWGPLGVAGNRADIEAASSKLISALWALHDWEISVAFVIPDTAWDAVFNKLRLSSKDFIDEMESFFLDFREFLSDPSASGQHVREIVIKLPKQLVGLDKVIGKAQRTSLPKSDWDSLAIGILKKFLI